MPSTGSDLGNAGSGKGHDDSNHVDCELELQKLGDAVVDVAAPHHSLYDADEVVVRQDDVGRLLGHVRACDALWNTDHGSAELNLTLDWARSRGLDRGEAQEAQDLSGLAPESVRCQS